MLLPRPGAIPAPHRMAEHRGPISSVGRRFESARELSEKEEEKNMQSMQPQQGDLARARIFAELFKPRHFWMATVRKNGITKHGRVIGASAEEASARAAIAGEVLAVQRMET